MSSVPFLVATVLTRFVALSGHWSHEKYVNYSSALRILGVQYFSQRERERKRSENSSISQAPAAKQQYQLTRKKKKKIQCLRSRSDQRERQFLYRLCIFHLCICICSLARSPFCLSPETSGPLGLFNRIRRHFESPAPSLVRVTLPVCF